MSRVTVKIVVGDVESTLQMSGDLSGSVADLAFLQADDNVRRMWRRTYREHLRLANEKAKQDD